LSDVTEVEQQFGCLNGVHQKSWELMTWEVCPHPMHCVTVAHNTWSGHREISLNGTIIVSDTNFFDDGSVHAFVIDREHYMVEIAATPMQFEYHLFWNNKHVRDDSEPPRALPSAQSDCSNWCSCCCTAKRESLELEEIDLEGGRV
jgi:hypothetical protein